ncbi:MAG: GDSL-type esterase/lipase family protein [Fibrobacter sp.]|nr:GDSL-type esterase/lipase family protein [Fibrobacter sp.]
MIRSFKTFFILVVLCLAGLASAKDLSVTPGSYPLDIAKHDFIDTTLNVIQFPSGSASFEPFFKKLDTLVFENRGQVRIMHIGGSHLQADVISGRIREHLIKEYPGANAGRGFVFPYSAAKTNTPSTYGSYYKGIWDMSKNVLREVKKPLGILGIAVSTSDPRAEISILLDRYNTEPMWGETKFRLFGYSDNGDVLPVLRVDSTDIYGVLDSASQSYLFTSPRPIDSINIQFRWQDSLHQATVASFIVDSLVQDSIAKANADTTQADSAKAPVDTVKKAEIPQNVALPDPANVARDSMFQGECDVLDTACLNQEEAANNKMIDGAVAAAQADSANANTDSAVVDSAALVQRSRPRFTLTGILSETDNPGISYTSVGINGARVPNYYKDVCPRIENELQFYKPDLIIFAIGINDANVEHFDAKGFSANYDTLITRFKAINPNVAFIFETNNDMYRKVKKRRYVQHPNGELARQAFFNTAKKHKAGVWDKFSIMGGLGSMAKWEKADLAKGDKVHFKLAGYNLLGDMFYKAFVNAYMDHIAALPAQEPVAPPPQPVKADTATTTTPAQPAAEMPTATDTSSK